MTSAAALAAGLPHQGLLSDDGPFHLYYLAAATGAGGLLQLETERATFELHFNRGLVEHAASSAPEDDLGAFLLARGAVTAEALADAARVREGFGGDLVAALASLRVMNPADSFRVLQEHGVAVVERALGAEGGAFRFVPGAPRPPSSFPLGSRWGLLCDAVRRLEVAEVRGRLGDREGRAAARSGGRVELAQLKLTAHEARAAALFDGRSSPAQLAAAHPAQAVEILRLALLLGETELLAFGEPVAPPARAVAPSPPPPPASPSSRPPAAPRSSAAAPRPVRPAPPSPPAAPSSPAAAPARPPPRDAAALRAVQARLSAADHFEALGVKRDASAAQIKVAYFQLAKVYHPDAGPPGEDPELKQLRADVFARLGEAWGVLGDDARRAEYGRELAEGGAGRVDVSAIFKAEELFQQATALVRSRQYEQALANLGEATRLNPEEPEFGVWAAWVQFLVAADRKRQHPVSAAAIEAALRKMPRCIPAYLFLGQMAKIMGDGADAERHFSRGLALAPENVELARELKYARK